MNPLDNQLDRLLRAARQAAAPEIAPPPFGLETRVLAAWREASTAPASFWDMKLLVRGMILAGVIMAVSFIPALTVSSGASGSEFADVLQLTDSTVAVDETP
ncbi:MAG: hypothetical protein WDO13_14910 [Verrucomicrobiota bacterium]